MKEKDLIGEYEKIKQKVISLFKDTDSWEDVMDQAFELYRRGVV